MEEPKMDESIEAEYTLETAAMCPHCEQEMETLLVVRLLRTRVNFTSALPRRGQVIVCSKCRAIVSGSLGGLI
jgi:hypothetical protein